MTEYLNSQNQNENKRSMSEDNKYDSCIKSAMKTKQKEEEIIKEIVKKKIPVNTRFLSKRIFEYVTRSHSHENVQKLVDLSDYDKEKVKFNEWINCNKEIHKKIEEETLKLLNEIFDKRHKLYPNNMCGLSPFALQYKKNVEIFCPKYYELSLYSLYVLYKQFNSFFEHMDEKINFKTINPAQYEGIKEILYYIGKDLKKIFKNAIEVNDKFKFSSVLIVMLEDYLIKNKKKEEKKIKNFALYKEKEKFDNLLKNIHNLEFQKDYENGLNKKIIFRDENENSNEENKINENKVDIANILDKNEEQKNEVVKNNNGETQNLDIDDLINFINQPKNQENKKKKKKKKKKEKKDKKKEKSDENKENNEKVDFGEDLVFLNFKESIEEYSKSVSNIEKIKPKYSEQFLKRLQLI